MSASHRIDLRVEETDDGQRLISPEVGHFSCALEEGRVVTPGMEAGVVRSLGRTFQLVVPEGVVGRVVSNPPERIHAPVAFGTVLYELAKLDTRTGEGEDAGPKRRREERDDRIFRAPHAGRFWHSASPEDPPFVTPGSDLEDGQPVGLIEVMKTFGRVLYRAGDALPKKAKVARVLVEDGGDVDAGDPLLELEG